MTAFRADTNDLSEFAAMFKHDAPKQAQWAVASCLTVFAAETRLEALSVIDLA